MTHKGAGVETVCQACGYQRRPSDQAADWQCPSCGKAYNKASLALSKPLAGFMQSSSDASSLRLPEASVITQKPNGPSFNAWNALRML